jgi:hypothetical protein
VHLSADAAPVGGDRNDRFERWCADIGWAVAMTYDPVRADARGHYPSAPRVRTFWVVFDGRPPAFPLCVALPDGREALALFSGREEARMFCSLGEEGEAAQACLRRTSAGEVLSLLCCPLTASGLVALDPLPEISGSGLSGPLALGRERFAGGFAGIGTPRGPSAPSMSGPRAAVGGRAALSRPRRRPVRSCPRMGRPG